MKEIALFLILTWMANLVMINVTTQIHGAEPTGLGFLAVLIFVNWRILKAVQKYFKQGSVKDGGDL